MSLLQINYNNSCIYFTAKEKSFLFLFALTHTLLSLSKVATLYSLIFIFFSTHSFFLAVFFFSKRLPLDCSLFFFFLVQLPLYLLLHILSLCLLEGSSTLLSPSSCVPPKRKSIFSLLVLCSILPLLIRRTLGSKAIKFFVVLSIYKTILLFPLRPRIHYLFNKESILSWTRNTLPF